MEHTWINEKCIYEMLDELVKTRKISKHQRNIIKDELNGCDLWAFADEETENRAFGIEKGED